MASLVAQQNSMNNYSNSQMRGNTTDQQSSQMTTPVQNYVSQAPANTVSKAQANGNDSKLSLTPTTTSSVSSASSPNYLSESIENYSTVNNSNNNNTSIGNITSSSNVANVKSYQEGNFMSQHQYSNSGTKTDSNWSAERKGE